MKKIIIYIFFFINYSFCFSQDYIKLSGNIVDEKTGKPIAFASISIKNGSIGNIANSNGDFFLTISDNFKNDTLLVSAIGYDTYKKCIKDLLLFSFNNIKLSLHSYSLKELKISDKLITVKQIMNKVKKNYKKNYVGNPYISDAYYREYIKDDTTFVKASELAMNIYNDGNARRKERYNTKINNVRLSKDFTYNNKNTLPQTINLNIIFHENYTCKSVFEEPYKDLIIDTVKYFQGHLVYVIKGGDVTKSNDSIKPNERGKLSYKKIFNKKDEELEGQDEDDKDITIDNDTNYEKPHEKNFITDILKNEYYEYCEFYVDINDYSIIYFHWYAVAPKGKENWWFKDVSITSYFEKYNDKYYPKLMMYFANFIHYSDIIKYVENTYLLMSINNIKFYNAKPFDEDERMIYTSDRNYLSKFKSDQQFWDNYNYYPDDKLRTKVFKDLDYHEKNEKK